MSMELWFDETQRVVLLFRTYFK